MRGASGFPKFDAMIDWLNEAVLQTPGAPVRPRRKHCISSRLYRRREAAWFRRWVRPTLNKDRAPPHPPPPHQKYAPTPTYSTCTYRVFADAVTHTGSSRNHRNGYSRASASDGRYCDPNSEVVRMIVPATCLLGAVHPRPIDHVCVQPVTRGWVHSMILKWSMRGIRGVGRPAPMRRVMSAWY